jgi:two-component system cell cycle response regulator
LEKPLSNERSGAFSVQSRDGSHYNLLTQRLEARGACRVLVVDDDALVRARLSALLNASGYDVEAASTGEEALRIVDRTHCHIVLTDWQMPDMNGLALCRHIRLRHHESYIYVLMLTIRDTEHDVMTGLAAGVDAYVVKGATTDNLLACLAIGRRIAYENSPLRTTNPGNQSFSHTDPATGAHSLGYLTEHLPRELARSQRHGHALAILQCDIEGFNPFIHRCGHEAGNELLRAFVAGANGCIRKGDWLARTAGAAFMIVLPETSAKGAHCAARKLRHLFAQHPLSSAAEPTGFTVSIGVTAVDAKHDAQSTAKIEAVLRAANRRTYPGTRLDGEQPDADAMAGTTGSARTGGKSGLN